MLCYLCDVSTEIQEFIHFLYVVHFVQWFRCTRWDEQTNSHSVAHSQEKRAQWFQRWNRTIYVHIFISMYANAKNFAFRCHGKNQFGWHSGSLSLSLTLSHFLFFIELILWAQTEHDTTMQYFIPQHYLLFSSVWEHRSKWFLYSVYYFVPLHFISTLHTLLFHIFCFFFQFVFRSDPLLF